MSLDPAVLRILCWAGAALALVAYFAALATRPSAVRMLNGSGLFLTGMGLLAASGEVGAVALPGRASASWMVLFLLAAAAVQAAAALRNRRAWDGADRRGGLSPVTGG